MRIAKIILVASIAAFVSLPVFGVSVISQVTTNSPGLSFVVTAQDVGTNKVFRVTLDPKPSPINPGTWSVSISFYAGTNLVSSRSIEPIRPASPTSPGSSIVYEFTLTASQWRDAMCNVSYTLTDHPAMVAHWFYLRDFADPKK